MKLSLFIFFAFTSTLFSQAVFSGDRLEDACLEFIKQNNSSEVLAEVLSEIPDQKFDEDEIMASFSMNNSMPGINQVEINFKNKSNELLKVLSIPVRIKIYDEIPVAARNLPANHIIKATDLISVRKLAHNSELTELSQLVGSKLKRTVAKGESFTPEHIEAVKLIQKGDDVHLHVYSGKILIKSTGQALNDAAVGERVKIKRNNNKIVQGIVYSDGTVVIR